MGSVAALGLVGLAGGGIAWAAADASTAPGTVSSAAGQCTGMYGTMYGKYSPMTAVANYLGLSRAELAKQMHTGKTLAEIATAQGKTVTGLESTMVAAMRRNLAADTSLTAAQRTAMLALMRSHLEAMVTANHPSGMGMDADDMAA
jgi:hypothetical protein